MTNMRNLFLAGVIVVLLIVAIFIMPGWGMTVRETISNYVIVVALIVAVGAILWSGTGLVPRNGKTPVTAADAKGFAGTSFTLALAFGVMGAMILTSSMREWFVVQGWGCASIATILLILGILLAIRSGGRK